MSFRYPISTFTVIFLRFVSIPESKWERKRKYRFFMVSREPQEPLGSHLAAPPSGGSPGPRLAGDPHAGEYRELASQRLSSSDLLVSWSLFAIVTVRGTSRLLHLVWTPMLWEGSAYITTVSIAIENWEVGDCCRPCRYYDVQKT